MVLVYTDLFCMKWGLYKGRRYPFQLGQGVTLVRNLGTDLPRAERL